MQKEPTAPYVRQRAGESLPFFIDGPDSAEVKSLRFATKEEAHIVVALVHKVRNLRHAGLAAIGFLGGQSILTKEQMQKTLADAVKPTL